MFPTVARTPFSKYFHVSDLIPAPYSQSLSGMSDPKTCGHLQPISTVNAKISLLKQRLCIVYRKTTVLKILTLPLSIIAINYVLTMIQAFSEEQFSLLKAMQAIERT